MLGIMQKMSIRNCAKKIKSSAKIAMIAKNVMIMQNKSWLCKISQIIMQEKINRICLSFSIFEDDYRFYSNAL